VLDEGFAMRPCLAAYHVLMISSSAIEFLSMVRLGVKSIRPV